jgi:hypothetical protein
LSKENSSILPDHPRNSLTNTMALILLSDKQAHSLSFSNFQTICEPYTPSIMFLCWNQHL